MVRRKNDIRAWFIVRDRSPGTVHTEIKLSTFNVTLAGPCYERRSKSIVDMIMLTRKPLRVTRGCLPGPREPFKRETAGLADGATEGTGGVFSQ